MPNKSQWNLFCRNFTVLVSQSMVDPCPHVIWFHCQGLNNYSGEAQAPSTPIQTLLKTADVFFIYESAFRPHEISKPAHRNLNALADPAPPLFLDQTEARRKWKRKEIESISEYWSEMSRRSPGKRESLDSLTTREISLTRSYRSLSALIKWEISPVYWNRSLVQ